MASRPLGATIRRVERLFHRGSVTGMSEVQLLDRFVLQHDDAAFEALVARHGPMVMGVCRQWLRDPSDAEDAFQATFLVLVRKAGSLRDRELLGNWLYGVAYRVALRARAEAAKRRSRESAGVVDRADPHDSGSAERCPWLHEEVNRLPEKYRAPVVLCYLEGRTHEEAAEQLCWPVGTVKGRLARARELLRTRLSRRGLAPSVGVLTTALSRDASTAIPVSLIESTVRTATGLAAAKGMAAGLISAQVAALIEGVCHTMFLSKLKVMTASLVVAGVLSVSAGVVARQTPGEEGNPNDQKPASTATPDPAKRAAPRDEARMRVELAQKALESIAALRQKGQDVTPEAEYQWSLRLLEAERQASDKKADRIAAAKAHLARMKQALDRATEREKAGLAPVLNSLETQYRYQEAVKGMGDAEADLAWYVARFDQMRAPKANQKPLITPVEPGSPASSEHPVASVPPETSVSFVPLAPASSPRTNSPSETTGTPTAFAAPSEGGGGLDPSIPAERRRVILMIGQKAGRVAAQDNSPKTKEIMKKLEDPIAMTFDTETPLEDVLKYLKNATTGDNDNGIPIYVDPVGLEDAEKTMTSPVKMDLEGVPLKTTLRLLLKQVGLAYCVKDGLLLISSPEGILQELEEAESTQAEDSTLTR